MKTHAVNSYSIISFKSKRTDKNEIQELKDGEKPILDNKKLNIYAALNNIAESPERKSIEFLLDVSKHLAYGQNGNSEFKDIIDKTTQIPQNINRENTDWSKLLADAIKKALKSSKEDVDDLEKTFKETFSVKKPLTEEEKEVLQLREEFLNSISAYSLRDAENLNLSINVAKKTDFFVSSSEISLTQKKQCLEKLIYLLSDKYKINPQLEDKKLQIINEAFDDLIIKAPDNSVLTTKNVNQLYSGICAAISICRKAVAYEDKVRYLEIIMDELSASDTIEIYDVTDLESGNKIKIPKIKIDYDSATEQGYRILDASAHIWMNNAHANGDGSIQTENYVAFDEDNYGIFNDTSWYLGFNDEFSSEKDFLKCLIMERRYLDEVNEYRKKITAANNQVLAAKKEAFEIQSSVNAKLIKRFSSIFKDKPLNEITALISKLIDFYSGEKENNEVNISSKHTKELKKQLVIDFIKEKTAPDAEEADTLNKEADNILGLVELYISEDTKVQKLQRYNTAAGRYSYYRKLYSLAAAHRLSLEADINLRGGVTRHERASGLPTRDKQITGYLKSLDIPRIKALKLIKEREENSVNSNKKTNKLLLQEDFETSESEELLRAEVYSDILKIETIFPEKLDKIAKKLFDKDIAGLCKDVFEERAKQVQEGDSELIKNLADMFNLENDKTKVYKYLNNWVQKLENPSDETVQEAVRLIGFEDRIHFLNVFITSFIMSLRNGISEEQFKILSDRFQGPDNISEGIENIQKEFYSLSQEYDEIIKKWGVPSARELIIKKFERKGLVLSEKKLDVLKQRFSYIRKQTAKNSSIENSKERKKANKKLYEFSKEEIEILESIESSLREIKKYCNTGYNIINKIFFEDLEEQYANIGMLTGQFWVREEGTTGLTSNEQIRIIEQMTGKPYHIQPDIEKAIEQIKEGEGSGIITYSVDDSSYAYHAQYVPSVTQETFVNPLTGEKEIQDIIWTDNSWGKSEKDSFYNGHNGFYYTDYDSGYGWKKGFVLSPDLKIGLTLKDLKNTIGINEEDKEKFDPYNNFILPGTPVNAYQKLYKMFNYILTIDCGEQFLTNLEKAIKDGYRINPEYLEAWDDVAQKREECLLEKINKQIKTKDDFDNLPDDDYLKFIMEMLSVYIAVGNPQLADEVLEAENISQLNEIKEDILFEYKEEIASVFGKSDLTMEVLFKAANTGIEEIFDCLKTTFNLDINTDLQDEILEKIFFDEEALKNYNGQLNNLEAFLSAQILKVAEEFISNKQAAEYFTEKMQKIVAEKIDSTLKIKSLESPILINSPLYEKIIEAIDKYMNPSSDEELLILLQGLQNADYETVTAFMDCLSFEDVGLNIKHPFEYVKKLQCADSSTSKAFTEVVATNVMTYELGDNISPDNKSSEEESPELLYRNLYVMLTEMDVQKYIKKFKDELFHKYKLRQAFPQPVVLPDDEIAALSDELFNFLDKNINEVQNYEYVYAILSAYDNIIQKYSSCALFKALSSGKDYPINNDTDVETFKNFRKDLYDLYKLTSEDNSLEKITTALKELLNGLNVKNGSNIQGKKAGTALNKLINEFEMYYPDSLDKENFIQLKRDIIANIKENVKSLVNSNITPEYRNNAISRINKIIDMIKNDAAEEEIDTAKDEFTDFLVEKHVIKNPVSLLKDCVNMLQEGKEDTKEYSIKRRYLSETLKIARQTKVQYKLVQNAHEGISSKTKELLSLFNVTMTDGRKEGMNTELGMMYLIGQLTNYCGDNTVLALFLNQSGLSKKAASAIMNNFEIENTVALTDEKYKEITENIDDLKILNDLFYKFIKKNPRIKSFNESISKLKDYINKNKNKFKTKQVLETYINYLNAITSEDKTIPNSPTIINSILDTIHRNATTDIIQQTNIKIDFMADVADMMTSKIELINSIELPESSEEFKKREILNNKYEEIQQYIEEKILSIREYAQSLDFIYTEAGN